jgi:hypothetical protein
MWNLGRDIRRESSQPGGISEADHIYSQLELLSGGLKSGQERATAPPKGAHIDVVFWQRQECRCRQSTAQLGAVCTRSMGCKPFLIVFNGTSAPLSAFYQLSVHF